MFSRIVADGPHRLDSTVNLPHILIPSTSSAKFVDTGVIISILPNIVEGMTEGTDHVFPIIPTSTQTSKLYGDADWKNGKDN